MGIQDWLSDRSFVGTPEVGSNALRAIQDAVTGGVNEALTMPVYGSMGDNFGDGSGVSVGGMGSPSSAGTATLGDIGIGRYGVGDTLGTMGTAAGMATGATGLGLAGNLVGTLADQVAANQSLSRVGLPDLGIMDYAGSVVRNSLPDFMGRALGIRTTEDRVFDRMHGLGYSTYLSDEDASIGWGGRDAYDPSHQGVSFENTDEDNDFGWGGGGSANEGGGGWSGGSDDRDIDSGGDW